MKENILMIMVVISLVLSITAVVLEVKDESSLIEPSKIEGTAWTSFNDGSESGLDADKVDSLDSSQFFRNDISGTLDGNLYVNGSITHRSQYRYYTLPAAIFLPVSFDSRYSQFGAFLYPLSPLKDENMFYAPIQLPDGAKITKLRIVYTKIDSLASLKLILCKNTCGVDQDSTYYELYSVELPLRMNFTDKPFNFIDKPFETENLSINVSNYDSAYWLFINMVGNDDVGDVIFNWVTIEYMVTSSLP